MILSQLLQWFDTSHYPNLIDKERARVLYSINVILMLSAGLFIVLALRDTTSSTNMQFLPIIGAFAAVNIVNIFLVRRGNLNIAAVVFILAWVASANGSSVQQGFVLSYTGVLLASTIAFSALLLPRFGLPIGAGLAFVLFVIGFNGRVGTTYTYTSRDGELFSTIVTLSIFAGLIYTYLRFTRASREQGANEALEERLRLAEITTQITHNISSRVKLNDVLNSTVDLIVQGYPSIYHAQIFLVDEEGHKARLVASSGEAGRVLLQRQHSLDVGSTSVIGKVTLSGESVVARARTLETVHRRNEILPDTLVEAAFPLMSGAKIIGALDLQSKDESAFQERDIPIFQTLADHIAVSIDNAQLFEQTEKRVEENVQLAEQFRSALNEVERLNRRMTGQAWSEYLSDTHSVEGLSVDLVRSAVQENPEWTNSLQEAVQHNEIVEQVYNNFRVVAAPLRVRGQVIGAMEFELDANGNISSDDLDLLQEVSERFGMAVENARLFDQSQRAAQREALINEIGSRLQQSNNVETTLTQAAQSLKQALKASRVSIRLGSPPSAQNGRKNGDK